MVGLCKYRRGDPYTSPPRRREATASVGSSGGPRPAPLERRSGAPGPRETTFRGWRRRAKRQLGARPRPRYARLLLPQEVASHRAKQFSLNAKTRLRGPRTARRVLPHAVASRQRSYFRSMRKRAASRALRARARVAFGDEALARRGHCASCKRSLHATSAGSVRHARLRSNLRANCVWSRPTLLRSVDAQWASGRAPLGRARPRVTRAENVPFSVNLYEV